MEEHAARGLSLQPVAGGYRETQQMQQTATHKTISSLVMFINTTVKRDSHEERYHKMSRQWREPNHFITMFLK